MDLKHLERDEVLVEEERKELEGTIQEQTSDIEKGRDQAKERLEMVNEEIQDLRALLAAKEGLAAELQSEYASHETSITRVRSKFSRQLGRLEKKSTALTDSRREWEAEKKHFDHLKESHESAMQSHSEALIAHDEMMKMIQEEITTAEKVEDVIVKEIVEAESRDAGEETSSESRELQAEVLKCEAAADEANQVLVASKAKVNNLKDEIDQIDRLIPDLEEQKKNAAASRDFKSAAKASKEIKEVSARKERLREELDGEAVERQKVAEEEFERIVCDLDAKKALANAQEKEGASKTLEDLGNRISRMYSLKAQVCCGENTVEAVAATVLDSEIRALKARGEAIGAKFGGWDEVMAEINAGIEAEIAAAAAAAQDEDGVSTPIADKETGDLGATEDDNKEGAVDVTEESREPRGEEEYQMNKEEAVAAYHQLKGDLAAAEEHLDVAINDEDYDKAAELDEAISSLKQQIEKLGLSDTEIASSPAHSEKPVESQDDDVQPEESGSTEEIDTLESATVDATEEIGTVESAAVDADATEPASIDDDDTEAPMESSEVESADVDADARESEEAAACASDDCGDDEEDLVENGDGEGDTHHATENGDTTMGEEEEG